MVYKVHIFLSLVRYANGMRIILAQIQVLCFNIFAYIASMTIIFIIYYRYSTSLGYPPPILSNINCAAYHDHIA